METYRNTAGVDNDMIDRAYYLAGKAAADMGYTNLALKMVTALRQKGNSSGDRRCVINP